MSLYSDSHFSNDIDDDELEEGNNKPKEEYNLKECTIYAIDCRPSMFSSENSQEAPFMIALKSIYSKLLKKINTRPNDQAGIVLFGTNEKNNASGKDHIYVLQSLDMLDAPRIKELDTYIKNDNMIKDKVGSSDAVFPFSDVLWTCLDIFSNAPKLSMKRVILITDNDDPTGGNSVYRRTAIQRVNDLKNIGIEIVLFGIDTPHHEFDKIVFYKDAVQFENDEKDELDAQLLSSTGDIRDLFKKIQTLETATRSEFRVPLEIAPGLTIGVRGFNMVIEQKLGTPELFFANQEQLQEAKTTTVWKCTDTGENLTPIDIRKAFQYGGEYVIFTNEEVQKISSIREPSLLVLGFRKINTLKAFHQISHPYFIYPDESQYRESKSVFFKLLTSLLKKKYMAICSFKRRANALPKIVALLPQAEKLDKEGNQIDPPGFQLVILPYADEIRPVPPHTIPSGYEKGTEVASRMINKLMINEIHYHNPFLENFRNIIHTIALDETEEREFQDQTIPNYKWIQQEAANEIQAFKEAVGLDKVIVDNMADIKRKINTDENSNVKKKPKLKDRTIPEHWEEKTLNLVTNPELKDFLSSVGIEPKKKKADLIDQIDGYLKTKSEQA